MRWTGQEGGWPGRETGGLGVGTVPAGGMKFRLEYLWTHIAKGFMDTCMEGLGVEMVDMSSGAYFRDASDTAILGDGHSLGS